MLNQYLFHAANNSTPNRKWTTFKIKMALHQKNFHGLVKQVS